MQTKYYFLSTYLPALSLDTKPDFSFDEYKDLLQLNLSEGDYKRVEEFLSFIDLLNLKMFWQKKPLDPRGNLDDKRLEEFLLVEEYFPKAVFEYTHTYKEVHQRLVNFHLLLISFYKKMEKSKSFFSSKYFAFEKKLRLVLAALRSKSHNRDLSVELKGEDLTDFFVKEIFEQKDASSYEPVPEFLEIKEIFSRLHSHPEKLHRQIIEFRLHHIDRIIQDHPFTIDEILGYTAKLIIILDFNRLSVTKGLAIADSVA